MNAQKRYRLGIDVGTHSIGFAAVSIKEDGSPEEILEAFSYIHDSGVDPETAKTGISRRFNAGVARRTRRLHHRRTKRLKALDEKLRAHGFAVVNPDDEGQTYEAWEARASLAEKKQDDLDFMAKFPLAIRHMARHRGWRNPYQSVAGLKQSKVPSASHAEILRRANETLVSPLDGDATIGQIGFQTCKQSGILRPRQASNSQAKARPDEVVFHAQIKQSDVLVELRRILMVQNRIDLFDEFAEAIFTQQKPSVPNDRVGNDPLPGQSHFKRELKASEQFQEFRIRATLANRRVRDDGLRPLSVEEQQKMVDILMNWTSKDERPRWAELAAAAGLQLDSLRWNKEIDDEFSSSKPPINETNATLWNSPIKPLREFWQSATQSQRQTLVQLLSNCEPDQTREDFEIVNGFLLGLPEDTIEKLESVSLPIGRAAYSEDSLAKLNDFMAATGADSYTALHEVFQLPNGWRPPIEPIGAQIGHPQVDRVTKQVARVIKALESKYGRPQQVIIEHVRNALLTEPARRAYEREVKARTTTNQSIRRQIQAEMPQNKLRSSDVRKVRAIRQQNGQCLYCGSALEFTNTEMDHIVPQAGIGSNNSRANLVAVCRQCNASKGKLPFAVWAESNPREGVSLKEAIGRLRNWQQDVGDRNRKSLHNLQKDVKIRLQLRTEDPAIDSRSMESVAYMARELHLRIAAYLSQDSNIGTEQRVFVYQGQATADARRAAGVPGNFALRGKDTKTRLDRRHHAVDALVLTMMTPSVARTLAERQSLRSSQKITGQPETWKEYSGNSPAAMARFQAWKQNMAFLSQLLQSALIEDRIRVTNALRLGISQGRIHDATISKPILKSIGDAFTSEEFHRIINGDIARALSAFQDPLNPELLIPEDHNRTLWMGGYSLAPTDAVALTSSKELMPIIEVHNGYASLTRCHHTRIYRLQTGKKSKLAMVRVYLPDILSQRRSDLFNSELDPFGISLRTAERGARDAILNQSAEYLGAIVAGDEVEIDIAKAPKAIQSFMASFPENRWKVTGFEGPTRINLSPLYLSKEGADSELSPDVLKILERGWRASISSLAPSLKAIIRRTTLGYPRWNSGQGNLPVCWKQG